MMRTQVISSTLAVGLFFILLFGFSKVFGPIPFTVSSVTTTKTDTFVATGEGTAVIKPDVAFVMVGIQVSGTTVKQVQDQINTVNNKIATAVKKLGVNEKDIQTTNYSINPTYDYQSGTQRITGYQANTSLQIKVRSLDRVNDVIDQATANGANQVGAISFDVDDKTKVESEARGLAVADAKKKAENASRIAGFRLGKIINYQENIHGGVIPMQRTLQSDAMKEAAAPPTQIEPGSSEFKMTVSISYDIQ